MSHLDAYQYYQPATLKKVSPQEQAERHKHQVFQEESGGWKQWPKKGEPPPQPPNVQSQAICVLDERGSHLKLGKDCPHGLLELDTDSITEVRF